MPRWYGVYSWNEILPPPFFFLPELHFDFIPLARKTQETDVQSASRVPHPLQTVTGIVTEVQSQE